MIIRCLRKSLSLAWNITVSSPTHLVHVVYNSSVVGGCSTFQTLPLGIQNIAGGIMSVSRSRLLVWRVTRPSFEDQQSLCILETAALRQNNCVPWAVLKTLYRTRCDEWLFPARCKADRTFCCSRCYTRFRAVPVTSKVHRWVWIKQVSGRALQLWDKLWGCFAVWCLIS